MVPPTAVSLSWTGIGVHVKQIVPGSAASVRKGSVPLAGQQLGTAAAWQEPYVVHRSMLLQVARLIPSEALLCWVPSG